MNKVDQIEKGAINYLDLQDKEIWCEIKQGSQSAFSFIYNKYVKNLFKYGFFLVPNKDIVEDAIHDIFVKIWTSRNNHIDIHSLKAYLYISLRREVLLKKNKLSKFNNQLDYFGESTFLQPSVEDNLINKENDEALIKKIRTFINNLSERQREVIFLRFYQDLSYQEIAELLHIDQNYAYNLASKAFNQIRKQF